MTCKKSKPKELEYIYAYDPKAGKRVVHTILRGRAVSMVTGHSFKFKGLEGAKK
jgi:hypothetical protein